MIDFERLSGGPFRSMFTPTISSRLRWWEAARTRVRGVSQHHDEMATFVARQILDTVAPSNFIATNPEVLGRTRAEAGANLARGLANFITDLTRAQRRAPPSGSHVPIDCKIDKAQNIAYEIWSHCH